MFRRVLIILVVLLLPLSLCVSASSGSVIRGETIEKGTGDKSPDNPYSLVGYLPEEFRYDGTIYGVPFDVPLYGDGTVYDEYDAVTGVEIRRWKRLVFDGTEAWKRSDSGLADRNRFELRVTDIQQVSANNIRANLVCTVLPTVTSSQTWDGVQGISLHKSSSFLYLYITDYAQDRLDDWKAYLAAQAAAGTPVTVVYQLAEPEVIQHEPVVLGKYMSESIFESFGWMVHRVVAVINLVTVSPLLLLGLAMWAAGGAIAFFRRLV